MIPIFLDDPIYLAVGGYVRIEAGLMSNFQVGDE